MSAFNSKIKHPHLPKHARQQGATTVIVAILFVIIIGYAVVVSLDMGSSEMTDTRLIDERSQARFIAEAGIESAFYDFREGTNCTALAPAGPTNFANGSFSISDAQLENGNCRVTAMGSVGNIRKTVSDIIPPGGLTDYNFAEHFFDDGDLGYDLDTDWPNEAIAKNEGSSQYLSSTNCPVSICPNTEGGSFYIETFATGSKDWFKASRERTIPLIETGDTSRDFTLTLGYKKTAENNSGTNHVLTLKLVTAGAGGNVTLWSDATVSNANTWTAVTVPFTLSANRSYDKIELSYNFRENGNNQLTGHVDGITLTYP